jgi:hypothetical protein
MGGRGAASGVSDKGLEYGTEFRTLIRVDNIKFVTPTKAGPSPVPLETMSAGRNRVYAFVNYGGDLKSIIFYDKDGKRERQIDLDHQHRGQVPHVHVGYAENHTSTLIPLTKSDNEYIAKVTKIWEDEKGGK